MPTQPTRPGDTRLVNKRLPGVIHQTAALAAAGIGDRNEAARFLNAPQSRLEDSRLPELVTRRPALRSGEPGCVLVVEDRIAEVRDALANGT